MRLTKIKLSGFKSFVDPVSIPVSSNLVGIVGPNGCGKSNIIDAVRWVMGESSAKHLRGDTMADVIFNGSSSRKPVGMASVELLFDNSSGALGGPYATYQTIAIKRQVSRDGQSVYMLNGSRCRRKDITDLFLGTGLGTRSYAIIEQGTISRLVEARPEDLRTMIEEAAGVSKYKDRRHDTENRIRHTRENLERLNDVRDEVEKQIRHLKQQAKKAESFKTLKAEERQVRKELLAIRWHSYREQVLQNEEREALAKAELESATGRQGDFDRRIAASRDEQTRMQQSVNAIQADLYAIGAEIVRAEQQIKLANQTRDDIESELKRLTSDRQRAVAELDHDKQQLTRIQREIIVASQTLGYAKQLEKSISGLKSCAERIGVEQKEHLDALRTELGRQKECLHVESSRIDQFVAQNRQYAERTQRLSVEKSELQSHRLSEEITELQNEIARLEDEREEIGDQLADLKELADTQKQKFRDLNDTLNDIRSKRQHCEGQIASLERLQQHAMGRDRGALNHWLKERRLESARRLARDIEVDPGWETAAETALGPYLEAVCVEETNPLLEEVAALVDETIAIIETGQGSVVEFKEKRPRLIDKVRSSCRIGNLLSRVFCAASLDEARAIASTLDAEESVITADGVWLGKGWIYLNRTRDQKTGVLARERELRGLNDRLTTLEGQSESIEIELNDLEEASAHSERLVEECRDRERKITAELSDRKTALSAKSTRYEQFCRRISQIEHELADLAGTFERNEDSIAKARDRCGEAERKIAELSLRSEALSAWHQSWQRFMTEINELYTDARADGLRREAALANLQSSEQLTGRHLERLETRHHEEIDRSEQLERKLAETLAPLQGNLEEQERLVEKRKGHEDNLKAARIRLSDYEKTTRDLAEQQAGNQLEVEKKREGLEKVRIEGQESRVRTQSLLEQLEEMHVEREAIPGLLPQNPDEQLWLEKIEHLTDRISRLGSINLAAIEEFEEQSKRLDYLNEQHADLTESLQTLEQAMRKIDTESRTRFKTTFDQINSGLQITFPKLFGGGQARLEISDEDLLEGGVNIIARPPGKRNASIHLLSGGEKALTAVALVFSIFELNPAPFCLLDEVDAPLDDTNVGRFSRLIEEMAERVQFIFITHNKVTMEIARHLAGVTMNEPGVSRMVAVDIDEAVELAVG